MLPLTPFQTVGPFFAILVPEQGRLSLAADDAPGQRIVVDGTVRDGASQPVPDALIEVWQANAAGTAIIRTTGAATGATRRSTGSAACTRTTRAASPWRPSSRGRRPDPRTGRRRRIFWSASSRGGLLTRLVTRIYFEDEPANRDDRSWPKSRRTAGRR